MKIVRAVLENVNIYIPTYIYIYTILARLIISGDLNLQVILLQLCSLTCKRCLNKIFKKNHEFEIQILADLTFLDLM